MNTDELKRQAAGRWPEIIATLGNVPLEILDGKHHPCPRCGGQDRFRLIDEADGALYCNGCFYEKNGDGISALMWSQGWDFQQAVAELREYLGYGTDPATPVNGHSDPKITAEYNYTDEQGQLLYQVVRLDPKSFRQRRPKDGGWEWTIKGTQLVPYNLPQLRAADPSRPVVIVEGEKDAERAATLGFTATTFAMGAGKWRPDYAKHFENRAVVIIPDNDDPGRDHAKKVARGLLGIAGSTKIVDLPGVPEKGDLSDWLDQGGTKEALDKLIEAAPEWRPSPDDQQTRSARKLKKTKMNRSQATMLVRLATRGQAELWHTPEGVGFITVPVGDHLEHWPIRSNSFRRWLQREFYCKSRAAINSQAIQDAVGVLEGKATFDGQTHNACVRVAEHEGSIYLDLGDADWRVVQVDAQGWRVLPTSPVKFRRCRAMQALSTGWHQHLQPPLCPGGRDCGRADPQTPDGVPRQDQGWTTSPGNPSPVEGRAAEPAGERPAACGPGRSP